MPEIDWNSIMNNGGQRKKRYAGANVKFFNAYNENERKSIEAGRPIFDEIPSISIQWPGHDETVRRIEPKDIEEYPEAYAKFIAGSEIVMDGTPLAEWPLMTGSAMRELQYLGFKTVEQLSVATDEAKRKLGPLSKFINLAKEWLAAANSDQGEIVKLKQLLERETRRREQLEHKLELFIQRVEASEGTDLGSFRKDTFKEQEEDNDINEAFEEEDNKINDVITAVPKRKGRPKKT